MAEGHTPQRKQIDWEAIQREYRAGILSVREIARRHEISDNLIRRRAKRFPKQWQRDLTNRVRAAVSRKIATDTVSTVRDDTVRTQGDEDRIVEEASDTAIAVVRGQRKSIAKITVIEEALIEELRVLQEPRDVLPLGTTEKPPALSTKVSTLLALVSAQEKRIRLERQAFGIADDSKPEEDGSAKITVTFVSTEGAP